MPSFYIFCLYSISYSKEHLYLLYPISSDQFYNFFIVRKIFIKERFAIRLTIIAFVYQKIIKPILFLFDPEFIHGLMIFKGEILGKTFIKNFFNWKLNYQSPKLEQKFVGINFEGPIG